MRVVTVSDHRHRGNSSVPAPSYGVLRWLVLETFVILNETVAMLGSMILLPLYVQELRWLDPLATGLLLVPGSLGVVVALGALSQITATTPYVAVLGVHLLLIVVLAALLPSRLHELRPRRRDGLTGAGGPPPARSAPRGPAAPR